MVDYLRRKTALYALQIKSLSDVPVHHENFLPRLQSGGRIFSWRTGQGVSNIPPLDVYSRSLKQRDMYSKTMIVLAQISIRLKNSYTYYLGFKEILTDYSKGARPHSLALLLSVRKHRLAALSL